MSLARPSSSKSNEATAAPTDEIQVAMFLRCGLTAV
jgi:hypothetical protein